MPDHETRPVRASPAELTIVGVGASAGGVDALLALFGALPVESGIAYVVVQHLSPTHESILHQLIANITRLGVHQAQDGSVLEADCVYIVPPGMVADLEGSTLRLSPMTAREGLRHDIDHFFRSLAAAAGSRAVGVVLSGTRADGAEGLREIKAVAGITIAQSPESAGHEGMPRAAIATGIVDLVLTPAEIAAELPRIARHAYVRYAVPRRDDDVDIPDEPLARIFELLRESSGVDFAQYKPPTIRRRLQRRMAINRIEDVRRYVRLLEESHEEVELLFRDILIHVTRFFREPGSFEVLATQVLPRLFEREEGRPVRIWVPGCATGEEPYSIAIAVVEHLGGRPRARPVQIFATDISEAAIEHARAGLYSEAAMETVSDERTRRFFTRADGRSKVNKELRDLCIFARQDLTRDPPFSRLDLVVCRNVLIYMGAYLQDRLMSVFHYALEPHGFLMLGASETIGVHRELFALVDAKHRLYQRKPGPAAPLSLPAHGTPHALRAIARGAAPRHRPQPRGHVAVDRYLLDRYAPAGVLVDADLRIVETRGRTGRFLELPSGEPTLEVLEMARSGLDLALRAALTEARESDRSVRREGVRLEGSDTEAPIEVDVEIVPMGRRDEGRYFLVLFEEVERAPPPESTEPRGDAAEDPRLAQLRRELESTRDYMQAVIQDLEAANEELQSANEEILSSNEELQSTNEELDTAKEELQSANEELNTVNDELYSRNEELARVNSDLVNLVGSVDIAIVIVDGDLRIRRFTPMAEQVLNLIESDLGRPISHLKPNVECPDLEAIIARVIDRVAPEERELKDRDGHWYLLQVRPYKSVENRIDGAVLALHDIDEAKRHALALAHARDIAEAIVATVRHPLVVMNGELRVQTINRAFCELFQLSQRDVPGRLFHELGSGQWDVGELRSLLTEVLSEDKSIEGYRVSLELPRLGRREVELTARRLEDGDGLEPAILVALGEVDPQRGGEP